MSAAAHDLLDMFAELVADKLAAKMRAPLSTYSSTNLPPGITRRKFAERCLRIAEARKDGRVWVVPVEAYEAALRVGAKAKPKLTVVPVPVRRQPDTVSILAASGIHVRKR